MRDGCLWAARCPSIMGGICEWLCGMLSLVPLLLHLKDWRQQGSAPRCAQLTGQF